jgi:hypothetical protein
MSTRTSKLTKAVRTRDAHGHFASKAPVVVASAAHAVVAAERAAQILNGESATQQAQPLNAPSRWERFKAWLWEE